MMRQTSKVVIAVCLIAVTGATILYCGFLLVPRGSGRLALNQVRSWAYQLQGLEEEGAIEALAYSHYDLLVIDPVRSDRENHDFDTASAVDLMHQPPMDRAYSRLVIAYVDIGEAEDWRWYWNESWTAPTESSPGDPDFLISPDPDGWAGNYPVAYWDTRWKDIMLYGDNSSIQQVLDDDFDGIYMDWIEAYDHEPVIDAATDAGLDPEEEMIAFIQEIRTYCRGQDPEFVLIAQNALDLCQGHPEYFATIDAVAQEHVLFDGEADTLWGDPDSGDIPVPASGEDYSTAWYVDMLSLYQTQGLPVFVVDYALEEANIAASYQFAADHGYIGFVSQTPLSQLP